LLSVLSLNPYVETQIASPGTPVSPTADVAIYEGVNLPAEPTTNSIWFLRGPSPSNKRSLRIMDWNAQHLVTRWVRTHDVSVRNPTAITLQPSDVVLAYTEGNPPAPAIVAREQNGHRILIVGFDPHESNFTLESAFPLLMAGGMEWMTHAVDESAASLSTGELDIPGPLTRIISPSGREVPFARKGSDEHLLASEVGIYRVVVPNGETNLAINAPLLPDQQMKPTSDEAAGVEREPLRPESWDLWRWLVLLAMVALWIEWRLYYSSRERQRVDEIQEAFGHASTRNADSMLEEPEFRESQYTEKSLHRG